MQMQRFKKKSGGAPGPQTLQRLEQNRQKIFFYHQSRSTRVPGSPRPTLNPSLDMSSYIAIRTPYSDFELISLCSYYLILRAHWRRSKYHFESFCFDPAAVRTHDLPHSRQTCYHDSPKIVLVYFYNSMSLASYKFFSSTQNSKDLFFNIDSVFFFFNVLLENNLQVIQTMIKGRFSHWNILL